MKARNIMWVTDEEDVDLPNEIEIPAHLKDEEEISDYISDVTGFCHEGYELEEKPSVLNNSDVINAFKNRAVIDYFAAKAEETILDALKYAENVDGTLNKTAILNAEHCMGQFYVYMDMIEMVDIDAYVEIGEKTAEIRHSILRAIEKIYK